MTPPEKPARHPSHSRGQLGEAAAAAWLQRQGYRIVARNLRTRLGEIDLLVRRRRHYAAVEVKTRSHHNPAPERSLCEAQAARLRRALLALAPQLAPTPKTLRIDVIAIRVDDVGETELSYFPGIRFTAE